MKTRLLVVVMAVLVGSAVYATDNITGLWKQLDDKTGKPESLVSLYQYEGKIYGRVLALYDDSGNRIIETTEAPITRSKGLIGRPYDCGLDFVYNLQDNGKEWAGQIFDPDEGKEYDCRAWKKGDKLILRGQLKGLGFLGRNQTWIQAKAEDFPPAYKLPSNLVPFIPVFWKK